MTLTPPLPAPTLDLPPHVLIHVGEALRAIELALRLGDSGGARRAACALLQHCPDALPPVVLFGQALLDSGDPEAAIVQFRRALKIHPIDATAWAGLAGALALCDQHAASDAALQRAALHDPLGGELLAPGIVQTTQLSNLGVVYLRRGEAALAVSELAATLEQHPYRDDLRFHYVEALRRCGNLETARLQLATFDPSNRATLPFLLLRAALSLDSDIAQADREQAARYDPDGQMTRRFFAPERPPWSLPPVTSVPRTAEFEAIGPYLALLPRSSSGQKSAAASVYGPPPIDQRLPDRQQYAFGDTGRIALPHSVADQTEVAPADPDVSGFVATTERLRQRLADVGGGPAPLVSWGSGRTLIQVLLSCKAALVRRYGESGFEAIDRRLRALTTALRRRGLHAHCCYIDDHESLRMSEELSFAPVAHDAAAVRDLVRAMADGLAQQSRELGVLLLIGGDDVIPFHHLANPLLDGDEAVLSDNPYASDDAGYLIPQRIVARIPDSAEGPPLLPALLDQMLEYHQGGSRAVHAVSPLVWLGGGRRSRVRSSAGYCAEVWQETSRAVLDALEPGAPLACCPPLDADSIVINTFARRRLFYANLHGAPGLPNWYGQPDVPWPGPATKLPIALRPDHFADGLIAGGLLISEACYGVDLAGRSISSSIPLRALAEGALACVGATVNAYGSMTTPLIGADLLCQRLLAHLQRGVPIGEALHQARLEFAQTMYRRQGYLDDVDVKTLSEFILLGDPWARLETQAVAPASWPVSKLAAIERVPKPLPKAVLSEEQVPRDLVQRARDALKRVLPGANKSPLYITAQPNPRLQRKGEIDQELVFSTQESRLTDDGYHVAQTALVTVSGRAVVKVALTR